MMILRSPETGDGVQGGAPNGAPQGEDPIAKARREEKAKLYPQLEKERSERERVEAELRARDAELKKLREASMNPDEKIQARLTELQQQVSAATLQAQQVSAQAAARVRAMELVAYKSHALRQPENVGIPEFLIVGNSEEEIDASISNARQYHQQLRASVENEYKAKNTNPATPGQPPPQAVAMVPQQAPTPPPNPAYVAPQAPYGVPGYPTPTNPLPVGQQQPGQMDLTALTSEEAVRSGQYGGAVRQQIMQQLRQMGGGAPTGPLGTLPRHFQPTTGVVMMPGQVQQPVGTPVAAPMNPAYQGVPQHLQAPQPQVQYQQQVQQAPQMGPQGYYTPPAPQAAPQVPTLVPGQPVGGNVAEAMAAVARTHAGQNPVAQGAMPPPGGPQAAAAAFHARFAPTPPAQGQGQ